MRILILLCLMAAVTLHAAVNVSVEKVSFSADRLPMSGVLTVKGSVNGLKQDDWFTLMVYPHGVVRDGGKNPYVARDTIGHSIFKQAAGTPRAFSLDIDLFDMPAEGTYDVYAYGWAPEFIVLLGSFDLDNSVVQARGAPTLLDHPGKALRFLGLSLSVGAKESLFPLLRGRTIAHLPAAGETLQAVYQVRNDRPVPWKGEVACFASDAYCRGDESRIAVSLAAGAQQLLRFPIPPSYAYKLREDRRLSKRQGGRMVARMLEGELLVDAELSPVIIALPQADEPSRPHLLPAGIASEKADPIWGRLTLVDAVDCATDEPAMQGAKSINAKYSSEPLGYYGKADLCFDWPLTWRDRTHDQGFTTVESILGRSCRTAENWGWFSYALAQGKIVRGQYYLTEIDYPEDKPRMFAVYNTQNANPGFHTGSSLGDPYTRQRFVGNSPLPLSQGYRTWRCVMVGSGAGTISINAMERSADPVNAGVAVSSIRMYRIETPPAEFAVPTYRYPPAPLPRRMIVHLQEDAAPAGFAYQRELMMYGVNAYSPAALFYCGCGDGTGNHGSVNWQSRLFDKGRYNLSPPPNGLSSSLDASAKTGLSIIPYFEYGGSSSLPEEALAVEADGAKSRFYWGAKRIDGWYCVDMAHPAVAEEFRKILDELGPVFQAHPNIKGIELTHRSRAWDISYSDYELTRFAKESGTAVPAGSRDERARWIQAHALDAYWSFHYAKKREVLLAIRDKLRSIRPDLVLYVLNYVADDHVPFGQVLHYASPQAKGTRDEFIDPADPLRPCMPRFDDSRLTIPRLNTSIDMRSLLEDYRRPDQDQTGIHPPLYRNDAGIFIWGPMHFAFTAASPAYLEFFRTGGGIAAANCWLYNEDAIGNNPAVGLPGLEGTEHAGPFCMMEEVLSVAAADPVMLGLRMADLRRGFPEYAQAFAKAYLALPALPSEVIDAGQRDQDVVVRRIRTDAGAYVAVINRGFTLAEKSVQLTCFPKGAQVTDLVTGESIPIAADGSCRVTLAPMSVRSFLAQ